MAVIDKVLTGESLVVTEGGDNEIAHIDLIMGCLLYTSDAADE